MNRSVAAALALVIGFLAAAPGAAQRKKKKEKEEITQTLEVLPDPPAAVTSDVERLQFHAAPLSGQGLLSRQTRDALRALQRLTGGGAVVRLRAFVAGTGDMRRVQAIVSEEYSERRQPLPAVSVVQVGQLPLEGAQVLIESISAARKPVNPDGLAFISGQAASSQNPLDPVEPLLEKSINDLKTAVSALGAAPTDVMRVSCFLSSLDRYADLHVKVRSAFPTAALTLLQVQRAPLTAIAECEAVARLKTRPKAALEMLNPDGLAKSPNYSQIALLAPGRVVLSGTQMAFRYQDSDVRLAFERLKKVLEGSKTSMRSVAMSNIYPLTGGIAERVRAIRFEYYNKSRPPASTMLPFEGLPSLDASFAVDVISVIE